MPVYGKVVATRRGALARATGRRGGKSLPKGRVVTKKTAKGAYKKGAKKQMAIRRKPFVEGKSRSNYEISVVIGVTGAIPTVDEVTNPITSHVLSTTTAVTNIFQWSYLNSFQSLAEQGQIGNAVYGRYLKCKLEFTLPSGAHTIQHPCDVWLVHGWVTAPLNPTDKTTPDRGDMTRTDVITHIRNHCNEHFDDKSDKLKFTEKKETNVKILGYRKIRPNNNESLGINNAVYHPTNSAGFITAGSKSPINMTCNWTVNRKIHYENGTDQATSTPGGVALQFMYPAYQWLPFVLVYNPSFADFTAGADYQIQCRSNNQFWYSDS